MRYLLPSVVLVLLLPAGLASADESPGTVVETRWERLHVAGAPAGYVHTEIRTVEANGEKRIESHVETDMKLVRMGATTHIHSTTETWEKPDGTLLRIDSKTKMSSNVTQTTFTFKDGKVTVETVVMGKTRAVEVDVEKDLVGPHFGERAMAKLPGTNGETVKIKSYMADFQRVVTTTSVSKGKETTTLHDGSSPELTRVESTLEGIPAFRPVSWLDAEGRTIKTSIKMSGMQFDTYRVASKEEALAKDDTKTPAPDVFEQTLITENDPIPVPRQLEQASITLKRRDETLAFPTFHAEGLTVSEGEAGALRITARRIVPPEDRQGVRPLATVPDSLKDALAASSMIQSDAPEIRKAAEGAIGDETNAWRAAQRLEHWVWKNMTQKNMNVAFASALEALETRSGDCTEHAVLLAALCRSVGIPARVVMGLEYLLGVWGGHAWNDVWIDGAWYQLDGTNGYGFVDPLHLPMAQMVMKEGGSSEFVAILGGIGNLDVDIVSVVRDGRPIRVDDSAELVKSAGGRYSDRIWGLQFDAPQGFVFDAPSKRKTMSARLAALKGQMADGSSIRIRVDAMDAAPGDAIGSLLKQMKADPKSVSAGTLDGRISRTVTSTRGKLLVTQTFVVADKALYRFTFSHPEKDTKPKALESFLASVDFDIK